LESYEGVFDPEEKAIRDHNITVIKHDLQRKMSEQLDTNLQ